MKWMRLAGFVLLLGAAILIVAVVNFQMWRTAPLDIGKTAIYLLPKGGTTSSVIRDIAQFSGNADSTRFPYYFRILVELTGSGNRLQAGEYAVAPSSSPEQLLAQLVSGEVITYNIRVNEGIALWELLRQLANSPELTPLPQEVDAGNLSAYLDLDVPFMEGFFLPDTYQVKRGDSAGEVLRRAHAAMEEELARAWSSRGVVSLDSQYELLILASIIEKETGDPGDRPQISQVFHTRLAKNMRLQTDPTVIYAIGERFDGNLRKVDLDIDSPFNTYRVKGLPPTPIALPSLAALEAAAHPAEGDYLYFVARGDGTSQFSRTLEEHNAAVRRYQLRAQ